MHNTLSVYSEITHMTTATATHVLVDERGVAWIDDTNVKVIELVLEKLAGPLQSGGDPRPASEEGPQLGSQHPCRSGLVLRPSSGNGCGDPTPSPRKLRDCGHSRSIHQAGKNYAARVGRHECRTVHGCSCGRWAVTVSALRRRGPSMRATAQKEHCATLDDCQLLDR